MRLMRILIEPDAEDDIAEAFEFLERHSPGQEFRLRGDLEGTIGLLVVAPQMGRMVGRDVYRVSLPIFQDDVVYELRAGNIYVLAVTHHRRGPNHWHNRL